MKRNDLGTGSVLWIDGEDGTRGGSIYISRAHSWLLKMNVKSELLQIPQGWLGIKKRVVTCVQSWIKAVEIRGTLPREILFLCMCRDVRGYVQSPVQEWSSISRLALFIFAKIKGGKISCVSKTTKKSLIQEYGKMRVEVEYAKFHAREIGPKEKQHPARRLVLIVMDNKNIDKGHLWHLELATQLSCACKTRVTVYGRTEGSGFESVSSTKYNGFMDEPFKKAKEEYGGEMLFYLGCSRYEGLHMAVVEAGKYGIPSLLSDIPAHRELEKICGSRLIIGQNPSSLGYQVKEILASGQYLEHSRKALKLFDNFKKLQVSLSLIEG